MSETTTTTTSSSTSSWTSQYIQEISQCGRELYTLIIQLQQSKDDPDALCDLYESINIKGSTMANLCTTQLRETNDVNKSSTGIFITEDILKNLEKVTTEFLLTIAKVQNAINSQKKFITSQIIDENENDSDSDGVNNDNDDDDVTDDVTTVKSFRRAPKRLIESLKKLLLAASQATKLASATTALPPRAENNSSTNLRLSQRRNVTMSPAAVTIPSPRVGSHSHSPCSSSRSPQSGILHSPVTPPNGGIDFNEIKKQHSKVCEILSEILSILSETELDIVRIKELVKPLYGAYQDLYQSGEEYCMQHTIADFRTACTGVFTLIKTVLNRGENDYTDENEDENEEEEDIKSECSEAVKEMMSVSERVTSEILMACNDDSFSQNYETASSTASGWDDYDAASLNVIKEKDDEIKKLNLIVAQQASELQILRENNNNNNLKNNADDVIGDDDSGIINMSAEREEIEQMRADLNEQYRKIEEDKAKLRVAIERIADFKRKNAEELALIEQKKAELEDLMEASSMTSSGSSTTATAVTVSSKNVNADAVAAGAVDVINELFPEFQTIWNSADDKTKEKYNKNMKKLIKKCSETAETVSKDDSKDSKRRHHHRRQQQQQQQQQQKDDKKSSGNDDVIKSVDVTSSSSNNITSANIDDDLDMIILAQASFAETFKRLSADRVSSTSIVEWTRMNIELELFKATLLKHSNYKDDALKSASYRDKVVRKASEMSAYTIQLLTQTMASLSSSSSSEEEEKVSIATPRNTFMMDKSLEDIRQCLVDLIRTVADDMQELKSFGGVIKVSEKLVGEIAKMQFRAMGSAGVSASVASMVEAGSRSEHLREKIILEGVAEISDASVRIVKVLTLIMSAVCNLPFTSLDDKSKTPLWELATWGHRLVSILAAIVPRFEITKALKAFKRDEKVNVTDEQKNNNENNKENNNNDGDISIWDEILKVKEVPEYTFTAKGAPQYVSLNKIIEIITSPDDFGTDTIKAAVSTALSFAEPQKFLAKLIERFNVPESENVDGMAARIKGRVCIALQHYIEAQFDDFDERTLRTLRDFVSGPLTSFNKGFGTGLHNNLERRERVARQRLLVSQIPSTSVAVYAGSRPLLDLFMSTDDVIIAQQMTLISTSIYASIKPKELLDLAWSKPKLQYRAANVIHFQERTALLSQFVAILALSRGSPEERADALSKVLDVMRALLAYNNFNDLMALYAGFANASVNRLQASKALVDPKKMKFLKHCDKILAPTGSFKHYRRALGDAGFASVPILSVVLSDLTFIDEGNPDTVGSGGLINFEKRALVYEKIMDLQKYQAYSPAFNVVEPLFSALLALPSCSDGVLYDLSLCREPRKPGQATLRNVKNKKF